VELDTDIQTSIEASVTRFEEEKATLEKNQNSESASSLSIRLSTLI